MFGFFFRFFFITTTTFVKKLLDLNLVRNKLFFFRLNFANIYSKTV